MERVDNFERRRELAATARLELETELATTTRLEAAKVQRDLASGPELRNLELARKLRGAPSSPRNARGDGLHAGRSSVFDAQPREDEHNGAFMTQDHGASRTARPRDADQDSISIEEWLEQEYERFRGAVERARGGAA